MLIISPIALMIAISHTLNKLATDSEIIVMNAPPSPFPAVPSFPLCHLGSGNHGCLHCCYLAALTGMRRLSNGMPKITADWLANILQPGRFAQLVSNHAIRIRERQPAAYLSAFRR